MNRFFSLLIVSLAAAVTGCAAPASTSGSGSFRGSARGAELNDSLDRAGTHVAKFEKQAEEIQRDVE